MSVFSMIMAAGIIITGLVAGFLSGLFGVGGGFILVPVLNILFGLPYNIVIGSSLASIAVISLFGMARHHKQSHINFRLGLLLLAGTIPGVEIGARILVMIKNRGIMDTALNISFLVMFITALVIMLFEYLKWVKGEKSSCDLDAYKLGFHCFEKNPGLDNSVNISYLIACGFLIGVLQGLLGVGGGFLLIPVLVNFFCLPARLVIGTSLFVISPSSALGAVSHYFKGNIDFMLVALILAGSVIGTTFGSAFTAKLKGKKIRLYFICLIALAALLMGIKIIS